MAMTAEKLAYFRAYRKANKDATRAAFKSWHETKGKAHYYENVELTRAIKRKSYYMTTGNVEKAEIEQQLIDRLRAIDPPKQAGANARFTPEEAVVRRKACLRKYRYKHVAGIPSLEEPDKCEACGKGGKICMDHNHKTSTFRGWLCDDCNLVLGRAKDDVNILKSLVQYLEERQ